MSRLIVKNLPKTISQEKLREQFSQKGTLTDIQLKYAKNGAFRRFAFVGYKTEEEAKAAVEFFNNTCIGSCQIQVDVCASLASSDKPRAWSKYAKDSSAYKKLHPEEAPEVPKKKEDAELNEEQTKRKKKKEKKEAVEDPKVKELLEKYKDDPLFAEFMNSHLEKGNFWSNDVLGGTGDGPAVDEDTEEKLKNQILNSIPDEDIASAKISDFEYLKRKMVKSTSSEDQSKLVPKSKQEKKTNGENVSDGGNENVKHIPKHKFFTVHVRQMPCKAKKKDIKDFFKPLKPASIRIPRNVKCIAYIGFKTEAEYKKALIRDRSFMHGKRIMVMPYVEKETPAEDEETSKATDKYQEQEESLKDVEPVSETGRIFVRNLSYSVTEEEIEALFSKYGDVSEIELPVDPNTRIIKGFAVVTFLLPEHAVRAFSELDGTVFEGRLLHLLPAKSKPSIDELLQEEGLDYKKKKQLLQKKMANSSHNWNTLFLGQNAVTDLIAETYSTSKEKVLDDSGKGSVAVRLALGETQLVAETRKFLIESGVHLDAFSKPATQRSKKVILAKNLPAKTQVSEIRALFEPHGLVGRVILPPSGVTALIEFMDSTEAKRAYLKLAYSKFKNLPLYLEWAPAEALGESEGRPSGAANQSNAGKQDFGVEDVEEEGEEEPEADTTLYLKNLSFKTREENLQKHFKNCGSIATIMIATKPNPKGGERLSQGYGFIQFHKRKAADDAIKTLQGSELDGHTIEIGRSHRTINNVAAPRKNANQAKQTGTKILVRNIPFQAKRDEVFELFKVFGEIKTLRLPQKMVGTGSHRGFAFVDFHTKSDAKRAMEALCHSTHLYGRRLVLEWAASDEEDVDTMRKRTAERFGVEGPSAKTFKKGVFDMKSAPKRGEDSDSE